MYIFMRLRLCGSTDPFLILLLFVAKFLFHELPRNPASRAEWDLQEEQIVEENSRDFELFDVDLFDLKQRQVPPENEKGQLKKFTELHFMDLTKKGVLKSVTRFILEMENHLPIYDRCLRF